MSGDAAEARAATMGLLGVGAGLVVALCLGGTGAFMLHKSLAKKGRAGWNLVPVVVAAVDMPGGGLVTMEEISQRSMPEQFFAESMVRPDEASYVVNQPVLVDLQAGDPLRWAFFSTADETRWCAEQAEAVAATRWASSAPVRAVVDAMKRRAAPATAAP